MAKVFERLESGLGDLARWARRLPEWMMASIILAAAVALIFGRLLLRPHLATSGSDFVQFYFWENFTREELLAGRLPLWNPYFFSGYPAFANPQMLGFYPPAMLLRLLPLSYSFGVGFAAHIAWAGLGTYWLVRSHRLGRIPAFVSAIAFMWSGAVVPHIEGGHVEWMYTIAWLPWVLKEWQAVWFEPAPRAPWLAGVVTGLMLLSGALRVMACAGLMLIVLAGFRFARLSRGRLPGEVWVLGLRTALSIALALGIAAPQLLPSLEFTLLSSRSAGLSLDCTATLSLELTDLLYLGFANTPFGSIHEWERHSFIGALGFALAVLGAIARPRENAHTWRLLLLTWGVGGLLLGAGPALPLYPFARIVLPILALVRQPYTFVVLIAFAGACLAGLGSDRLLRWFQGGEPAPHWSIWIGIGPLMVGMVLDSLTFNTSPRPDAPGLYPYIRWFYLFSAPRYLLVAVFFWWSARAHRTNILSVTILTLLTLDMILFSYTRIPILPAQQPRDQAAYVPMLDPAEARVVTTPYTFADQSMAVHTANAQGYAPIVLGSYAAFTQGSGPGEQCPSFEHVEIDASDAHLLRLLSVKYLVSPWTGAIEIPDYYPRALWVGQAVTVATIQEAVAHARAPGFDPASIVYVEGEVDVEQASADGLGQARIASYETQSVAVEVESDSPGWLVLNDVWYPGWEARVNGEPTRLYRANGAFRAVPVPAGYSRVTFEYHSTYLNLGLGIGIATLILMLGVWLTLATRSTARPAMPSAPADS